MPAPFEEISAAERLEASRSEEDCRQLDELFGRLYDKIRRLAARVRWRGAHQTLNPTALAHEAYMKLRRSPPNLTEKSYDEVIGVFANAMQQILMDAARRKHAQKRVASDPPVKTELPVEEAINVGVALEYLEAENPRQAQVIRCRFLLGMTTVETAAALSMSPRLVEREWQRAREALGRRIDGKPE